MQSFREPIEKAISEPSVSLPLSPNILVSMSALPLIAGLISSRLIADGLTQLGRSSEEFFRGERLPVLPLLKDTEPKTS